MGRKTATSRRPRVTRLMRTALALVVLVGLGACGGQTTDTRSSDSAREEPTNVIELDGVSIEVPPRWDGYALRIGPREEVTVIWAASTPFVEPSPPPEFPHDTLAALPEDGIAVEVVAQPPQTDSVSWTL